MATRESNDPLVPLRCSIGMDDVPWRCFREDRGAGTDHRLSPRSAGVAKMGRLAEDAGADSLWVKNDHVLMVEDALDRGRSLYPFSEMVFHGGPPECPGTNASPRHLSWRRLRAGCEIGTSIFMLPQRNVLELAKTTATLDALGNGRLVLRSGGSALAPMRRTSFISSPPHSHLDYAILTATPSSSLEASGKRCMTSGSWPGTTCAGESASERTISKASYILARSFTTL